MKLEILTRKNNPLMKREEVRVSLEHPGKATPPRKEILPEVAKKLKAKEGLIIVDKIFTTKGKTESRAKILVYKDEKSIPKAQLEKQKRRMSVKEKKPEEVKEKTKEEPEKIKESKG